MAGQKGKPNTQTPARRQGVDRAQPDNQNERAVMLEYEAYQGAIPHPLIVKGWEEIKKGTFDQILTMTEKDQQVNEDRKRHEMEMESKVVDANIEFGHRELNLARNAQIFIFLSVLALIILAGYLFSTGADIGAYAALVTALAPIITAVIRQTTARKENTEEKKK